MPVYVRVGVYLFVYNIVNICRQYVSAGDVPTYAKGVKCYFLIKAFLMENEYRHIELHWYSSQQYILIYIDCLHVKQPAFSQHSWHHMSN